MGAHPLRTINVCSDQSGGTLGNFGFASITRRNSSWRVLVVPHWYPIALL